MRYIVYPDVLFVINFLIDYVILRGMNSFLKCFAGNLRCIAGASLGAAYSCIMLYLPPGFPEIKILFTYGITAFSMLLVAFGRCGIRELIKRFIMLYVMSFLLSGILNFLYLAWGIRNILYTGITFVILKICVEVINNYRHRVENIYRVKLEMEDRTIDVRAYLDTGNSLREPISGKPVSILNSVYLKKLTKDMDICTRYRYIPFHSVGEKHGSLLGIQVDCMYIDEKKYLRPIIAAYDGELSSDGEYEMLLNVQYSSEIGGNK